MNKPKLIKNWEELKDCESETHYLEIDVEMGNGYVRAKNPDEYESVYKKCYLTTHTFYGSNYAYSTKLLQDCGFNIELENWDK